MGSLLSLCGLKPTVRDPKGSEHENALVEARAAAIREVQEQQCLSAARESAGALELELEISSLRTELVQLKAVNQKQNAELQRHESASNEHTVAHTDIAPELQPLQQHVATTLRHLRNASAEAPREEATRLPEALRSFTPLAEEPSIRRASEGLHVLELAVARAPDSEEAVGALRSALKTLSEAVASSIKERTEGLSDEDMAKLVATCQAAIASGNRDFHAVYDGVFNVIKSGDVENYNAYGKAIEALRGRIKQGAQAKQRDE